MKRIDDRGLSGAMGLMIIVIILLILLTGGLSYTLLRMGPGDEPDYVIEDVYFEEDESRIKAMCYVTNLGRSGAEGEMEWEVTRGDRLIEKGNRTFQIEGRSTNRVEIFFEIGGRDSFELRLEVYHREESMDEYSRSVYMGDDAG